MENITSSRPRKACVITPSAGSAFLFLITRAFVHFEFIEGDRNKNQHCYLEILVWLHDAVCLGRPELQPDACILHHDNLFTHDVLLSGSFWPKN
jgi:hypothetical protein